jgi:spore germination cell wall hydrolase CwlJ-like protein
MSDVQAKASELACLSSAIYYESVGEPFDGQVAVAHSIIERKNNPKKYPKSVCTIISEYRQYPWFNRLNLPIKVFDETKKIAEEVLAGKIQSKAQGATHFHSTKVNPKWSKEMIHITTIGNHKFYKEKWIKKTTTMKKV